MSGLTLYRDGKEYAFRRISYPNNQTVSFVYNRKARDGLKTILATMTEGKDHIRYRVTIGTQTIGFGHATFQSGEVGDYLDAKCQIEEAVLDIISNREL